jgi:hypothetical protein
MRTTLVRTWDDAVEALKTAIHDSTGVDDATAAKLSAELVNSLPDQERKAVLIAALLRDARHALRMETLSAERSAEILGSQHRTTAEEWEEAAKVRRERYEERERRRAAEIEAGKELRRDLGIPEDSSPLAAMAAAMKRYAAELKMEWTRELLQSAFALRDGSRVTWGAATIAEHRERIEIFVELADSNLKGAARHEAAITAIQRAGTTCLNEVVTPPLNGDGQ